MPSAREAGVRQEKTRLPSTSTEQAPHWLSPQPYLAPVSCRSSRRTSSNGRSGSVVTVRRWPFTVKFIVASASAFMASTPQRAPRADPARICPIRTRKAAPWPAFAPTMAARVLPSFPNAYHDPTILIADPRPPNRPRRRPAPSGGSDLRSSGKRHHVDDHRPRRGQGNQGVLRSRSERAFRPRSGGFGLEERVALSLTLSAVNEPHGIVTYLLPANANVGASSPGQTEICGSRIAQRRERLKEATADMYGDIYGGYIGRLTTSGVETDFPLSGPEAPGSMVLGSDGNLWFAATTYNDG